MYLVNLFFLLFYTLYKLRFNNILLNDDDDDDDARR